MSHRIQVRETADAGRGVFALTDFQAGDELQADIEPFVLDYMQYCRSGADKEKNVADLSDAYVLAMHLLLSPAKCEEFNACLQPSSVQNSAGFDAIRSIKALRMAASRDATFQQLVNATSQQVALTMAQCRINFFSSGLMAQGSDVLVFFILSKTLSMYNHSCEPNARFRFEYNPNTKSGKAVMIALKSIVNGDEIFYSYLSADQLLLPVEQRRALLKQGWLFECQCSRCANSDNIPT